MKEKIDKIYLPHGEELKIRKSPRQIIEENLPEEKIIETPTEKVAISWRRNFDRLKEIQDAWREVYPFKDEITVRVDSEYPDVPHLLGLLADPHTLAIGQSPLLGIHIDKFETTPNTSLGALGDIADFGIKKHFEVRFLQGIPVPVQPYTVRDIMEELTIPERNPRGKKILQFNVTGNHTYEQFLVSGVLFEYFIDDLDLDLLPGIGMVNVEVGDQTYKIGVAHKYWGNSRINKTLSPKRLLQFVYPQADLLVVAHQHWKAYEVFRQAGERKIGMRPGHYRTEMPIFEKVRGYWETGNEGMTCVMLHPDIRHIEPYDSVEYGLARLADWCELDDYRKGYK